MKIYAIISTLLALILTTSCSSENAANNPLSEQTITTTTMPMQTEETVMTPMPMQTEDKVGGDEVSDYKNLWEDEITQTNQPVTGVVKSEPKQENSSNTEINYIANKNTKKFHLPSCGTLPKEKNRVYYSNRDDAVADGYKPCHNCEP